MENKERKLVLNGTVEEVRIKKKTGRLLDWYYITVRRKDEGDLVTVEYEANGLEERLPHGTKIAILAYHHDTDENDEPADRFVAKSLEYGSDESYVM